MNTLLKSLKIGQSIMIDQDIKDDYMSSTSSNEYNKYIFELKLKLSDSQIKNIFGSTELAMLDCSDMTDEEIDKLVDKWNEIPELQMIPVIKGIT